MIYLYSLASSQSINTRTGTTPSSQASGGYGSQWAVFHSREMFVAFVIWLILLTIFSILVLALIIYRIRQIRTDIKAHLRIVNKQVDNYFTKYLAPISMYDEDVM